MHLAQVDKDEEISMLQRKIVQLESQISEQRTNPDSNFLSPPSPIQNFDAKNQTPSNASTNKNGEIGLPNRSMSGNQ